MSRLRLNRSIGCCDKDIERCFQPECQHRRTIAGKRIQHVNHSIEQDDTLGNRNAQRNLSEITTVRPKVPFGRHKHFGRPPKVLGIEKPRIACILDEATTCPVSKFRQSRKRGDRFRDALIRCSSHHNSTPFLTISGCRGYWCRRYSATVIPSQPSRMCGYTTLEIPQPDRSWT